MAIVRVDPFREFAALQERVNRVFGNVHLRQGVRGSDAWTPLVDIYETDGRDLVLKAEIPDMTREDIDVTVQNDTLTFRGERKRPGDVKDEQFHHVERPYGAFTRSFSLPNTVDASRVSADYRDGVLTVRLPFREDAKPRTITVNVAA
jgi:HSP20 family protein